MSPCSKVSTRSPSGSYDWVYGPCMPRAAAVPEREMAGDWLLRRASGRWRGGEYAASECGALQNEIASADAVGLGHECERVQIPRLRAARSARDDDACAASRLSSRASVASRGICTLSASRDFAV